MSSGAVILVSRHVVEIPSSTFVGLLESDLFQVLFSLSLTPHAYSTLYSIFRTFPFSLRECRQARRVGSPNGKKEEREREKKERKSREEEESGKGEEEEELGGRGEESASSVALQP